MFFFQFNSRQSFVDSLVRDAVDARVGPLRGLDDREAAALFDHLGTLPRMRKEDNLIDFKGLYYFILSVK
jgi:hypothetical protein